MNAGPPVWVELHVDDELLDADNQRWPEARALIESVANIAEEQGARLCFRFRETFSRCAVSDDIMSYLLQAGHEIGVHAHGKGFARAVEAIKACGVEPQVAVPGLVQAGLDGRAALLKQVSSLGFTLVTDHGVRPAWAYEGFAAREENGLMVMAPTVRPTDWGLISKEGQRVGFQPQMTARLRVLEHRAFEQGAEYFGVAFHEHDLCSPGSLKLTPEAIDGLRAYLDERIRPAAECLSSETSIPVRDARPLSDRRTFLVRKVNSVMGLGRGRVEMLTHRARKSRRLRSRRPDLGPNMEWIEVNKRAIVLQVSGSTQPRAICLMSHAGLNGGIRQGLAPFGLGERDLAREGWALWTYDRSGTGLSPPSPDPSLSPGNPAHIEDWLAVLGRARLVGLPIVALSWSSGIVPVLNAILQGVGPDALVDGEGPSDRRSLVPPRGPKSIEMRQRDPWNDALWMGLEAEKMISEFRGPYARLQGEQDHVHGGMTMHANRMWMAAEAGQCEVWPPNRLAGHLHGHPSEVLEALDWARNRIGANVSTKDSVVQQD